jgi:hypothetical protein
MSLTDIKRIERSVAALAVRLEALEAAAPAAVPAAVPAAEPVPAPAIDVDGLTADIMAKVAVEIAALGDQLTKCLVTPAAADAAVVSDDISDSEDGDS